MSVAKRKLLTGYVHTQVATTVHKFWVGLNITRWVVMDACDPFSSNDNRLRLELCKRAVTHDLSKYRWDEAKYFAANISKLKDTEYGTDAYQEHLKAIKPALDKHYQRNRHHPQWHHNGVGSMSLADRIEMIADWGASCRRNKNGNFGGSMNHNVQRFSCADSKQQLLDIAEQMKLPVST